MNPIQKQLLGLGVAVMLAMLIFPPWTKITHHAVLALDRSTTQTETQEFAGYSLLFEPPPTRGLAAYQTTLVPGDYYESVKIDFDLFLLQWLTAVFLTAAGLLFFKGSNNKSLAEWWSGTTAAEKSRPTTNPPKPPILRQAPPISETQVPTDAGFSKQSESTPPSRMSPWKRADKAFGIGCFVGIASVYQGNRNNPDLSSSERMLMAGILGVVCGLVAYLFAVVYYAGKGKLEVTAQTDPTKARNVTRLIWVGVIGLYAFLWLIEKNKETKTPQENPNSSAASQAEKPNNAAEAEAQAAAQVQAVKAKAEAGDAGGQFVLGECYLAGRGVQQDYAEAVKWLNKAAEQSFVAAQQQLGEIYYHGSVVEQNYREAEKWFRKAAEQDYSLAQDALATMYSGGVGVPQNFTEAYKWYYRAAAQGNADALGKLGLLYLGGWGVQPDGVAAYQCLCLAVTGGATNFVKERYEVMLTLSPEQIAEGQRRAAAFVPHSSRILENQFGMTNGVPNQF